MKILRFSNNLTVILNDNTVITNNECTDELYNEVLASQQDEEKVKLLLMPKLGKITQEIKEKETILENFSKSKYITRFGPSLYIKSISELILPEDLAMAIIKAENEKDEDKLQSYLNFWTLASNNPDSRARHNLFWFLNKWGMRISKSGFVVAYRNVDVKEEGSQYNAETTQAITEEYSRIKFKSKKSPKNYTLIQDDSADDIFKAISNDKEIPTGWTSVGNLQEVYNGLSDNTGQATTYTDRHTGKSIIQFGKVVSMPRKECDSNQNNTCSSGFHTAGREWLDQSYYGEVSIMCLVSPADYVAIPPSDNYGKARSCAYLPCCVVKRDEKGVIIDDLEDGFDDGFLDLILESGKVNNEDTLEYTFNIPSIPEISKSNIISRLEQISLTLKKKEVV